MITIKLPNHNNKLQNEIIVHIGKAPEKIYREEDLPARVLIEDSTPVSNAPATLEYVPGAAKSTSAFQADMIAFSRMKIHELGSLVTYPSHGMCRKAFLDDYRKKNPGVDQVAVYIFKRITE